MLGLLFLSSRSFIEPRDLSTSMHSLSRKELRQTLRQARRSLEPRARAEKEAAILQALSRHPHLKRLRHLALYWPGDGEVDLRLFQTLKNPAQHSYLPVLARGSRLRFAPWTPQSTLRPNRFGIPEPHVQPREYLRPSQLDAVLMPLVGFDKQGNRLGMGGGFYDRSFAFRHARRRWRKPLLIGVAFELQRCTPLPAAAWDVPLDGIVTEHGLRLFNRR